jgi:acyl-CoA thioester hydrolase
MTAKVEAHHLTCRVYYEDTDAGGIVYHANYLRFAERARTEWLRSAGYDHKMVKDQFQLMLVVRHAEIEFRAPGRLDDVLDVHTTIKAVGKTSLSLLQSVHCQGKVLADLAVTVVAVALDGKAVRLPPQLRQIFSSHTSVK